MVPLESNTASRGEVFLLRGDPFPCLPGDSGGELCRDTTPRTRLSAAFLRGDISSRRERAYIC